MAHIRYIDLFAGIGGFHLAMSHFYSRCVFVSEWDHSCQEVYAKNYGILPKGDITKITENEIPEHDMLCAGFPCQAFSLSGKMAGFADTRGTLFFDIVRIARKHRPKVLFLENVKNFASHDKGQSLKTVLRNLDELGYHVFHQILNGSDFGIPQKRERIYFVALRSDLGIHTFSFPSPIQKKSRLIDYVLPDKETQHLVIHRTDLTMKESKKLILDKSGHYPQKPIRIGIINKGGQGERIYHAQGHAITFSAYGGGIGAKTGLYEINGKIRRLAPRECARLSGFPDQFILSSNNRDSYRQFGNSVVINVVKAIIKQIIKSGCFER